jgi:lysophospholipase L1-like esterase
MKNERGELNADLSLDGIHLNAKGYLIFANIIKKFL